MVVDFQHVKRVIKDFDHIHLNSQVENPTAESVAEAIFARIRVFILSDTFGNKDAYVKYLKLFETLSGSVTIWPS